jgi:murein DD-endopeptidase MepM/ murein hydrolase activator NlpD
MKTFFILVVLAILGAVYYFAGKASGPAINIVQPVKAIGKNGELVITVETPKALLKSFDVTFEQGATKTALYSWSPATAPQLVADGENKLKLTRAIGKAQLPDLVAGTAKIKVTAVRPVLFGLREVSSSAERQFDVRLTPPTLAVLSTHHYINLGGSEMVVYRVTPNDVKSGVLVGDKEYPGYPASGAGIPNADPALRVAFFALLWNQDVNTPISVFARDDYGNDAHATFDYRVFPKKFRDSKIPVDDRFLARVVPAILQNTPELKVEDPSNLLQSFLRINNDLRKANNARITALAASSSPQILWKGAFKQMTNSAVEGGFADQRTYIYNGQEVDHQTHLGFDLASTAATPVHASNSGRVVHAGWLGIYGNAVIVDHGMGLQSIYAHMSSIDAKVGDSVAEGATLGRSGATGLAGGDHLHFSMLLGGSPVTAIDWWSTQWVQDRIMRKLQDAGLPAPAGATADTSADEPADEAPAKKKSKSKKRKKARA